MAKRPVCLLSGASSGIGLAAAAALNRAGFIVYGTSRRVPLGEVAEENGIFMIQLDTTDDDSAAAAVALVWEREGRLDLLVNNAGSGIAGPLEDTTMQAAFGQMDVNFFGPLRLCRAVLPLMRQSGGGRIINIGSVAAFVPIPFQTLYSASKSALFALTEGLALEAAPFGVQCGTVDPGDTKTGFTDRREKSLSAESVYASRYNTSVSRMEKDEQGGTPPEKAAQAIVRMALAKHMPARKTVGFGYGVLCWLARVLPVKLRRLVVGKLYG